MVPQKNAFQCYKAILEACLNYSQKDILYLLAIGPTATILANDLANYGYQAIDIGHLDIEYEWFTRCATTKIVIPDKYTNETKQKLIFSGRKFNDHKKQIIKEIK